MKPGDTVQYKTSHPTIPGITARVEWTDGKHLLVRQDIDHEPLRLSSCGLWKVVRAKRAKRG